MLKYLNKDYFNVEMWKKYDKTLKKAKKNTIVILFLINQVQMKVEKLLTKISTEIKRKKLFSRGLK